MRVALLSLALIGFAVGARGEVTGVTPDRTQDAKACDLSKVEKGLWCAGCKVLLAKEAVDEKGNCKKCTKPPKEVEICVKIAYGCPCGKEKLAAGAC